MTCNIRNTNWTLGIAPAGDIKMSLRIQRYMNSYNPPYKQSFFLYFLEINSDF